MTVPCHTTIQHGICLVHLHANLLKFRYYKTELVNIKGRIGERDLATTGILMAVSGG